MKRLLLGLAIAGAVGITSAQTENLQKVSAEVTARGPVAGQLNYQNKRQARQSIRYALEAAEYSDKNRAKTESKRALHFLRGPRQYGGGYEYAEYEKYEDWSSNVSQQFRQDTWSGHNRWQKNRLKADALYAVRIFVPKKWGFFHGNDPIKVGKVVVRWIGRNGQERRFERDVNRVLQKKQRIEIELPRIAKNATVTVFSAAEVKSEVKDCALDITAVAPTVRDSWSNPDRRAVDFVKDGIRSLSGFGSDLESFKRSMKSAMQELGSGGFDPDPGHGSDLTQNQRRQLRFAMRMIRNGEYREAAWKVSDLAYEVDSLRTRRKLRRASDLLRNGSSQSVREASRILRGLLGGNSGGHNGGHNGGHHNNW